MLISDDHAGLRAARRAVFPALPWQRCQFHLSQNAQRFARRLEERGEIGQAMRDIFNSPTLEDVEAMLQRKIEQFSQTNQALAQWMEDNVREGLTVYAFPRSLHKKIRTINGVENLNKRIRRRTRLVAFLHTDSALRLISAAMAEVPRRMAHAPMLSEPGESRKGRILSRNRPGVFRHSFADFAMRRREIPRGDSGPLRRLLKR